MIRHARELLATLDARERRIIERRFGLDGQPADTLATIGASMSLTRYLVDTEAGFLGLALPRG